MSIKGQALRVASRILPSRPVVLPVLGGPLFGSLLCADFSVRIHYLLGRYERNVARVIIENLKAGQVAYDVGAHVGYLALVMGKSVGRGGCVVAFEPSPHAFPLLLTNAQLNSRLPIKPLQIAVADRSGKESFSSFPAVGSSRLGDLTRKFPDSRVVEVALETVDHLVDTRQIPAPDFVKIDVEGAEYRVIQGMMAVLEAKRPTVLVEHHWPGREAELSGRLARFGYSVTEVGRASGGTHLLYLAA